MIFAHGSRFGGHSLFIKDKKLYYVYNFLGIPPEQQFVSPELKPGKYTLGMEFTERERRPVPRVDRHDQALRQRQGRGRRPDARAGRQIHAVRRRPVRRPRQRRRGQPGIQAGSGPFKGGTILGVAVTDREGAVPRPREAGGGGVRCRLATVNKVWGRPAAL